VWNPHHQLLIEKLEKVQKKATKLVIAVRTFKYADRLKCLDLPTLKYRRMRGDMIEIYKRIVLAVDRRSTGKDRNSC